MQQLAVGLIDVNTTSFIIDHDYVSRLVDADSLRTHQLAAPDLVYIFALWGKDAHPLVVVIGHEEVAVCRHRNAGWSLELTGLAPSRAETEQTVSVARKDLARGKIQDLKAKVKPSCLLQVINMDQTERDFMEVGGFNPRFLYCDPTTDFPSWLPVHMYCAQLIFHNSNIGSEAQWATLKNSNPYTSIKSIPKQFTR